MTEPPPRSNDGASTARRRTLALALGALGVVYGDIGTSPLYAIKECFHGLHAIAVTEANVLGVLSLVFWSLASVVSFKYIGFIMRADNRGEGGMFALLALIPGPAKLTSRWGRPVVVFLALFGASLIYGDGVITPAISVLSAIEGLEVATSALAPAVVPITVAILLGIFLMQRHGTGVVGKIFGPVTLVWFLALSILGVSGILRNPGVLAAVDPRYAVDFFVRNQWHGAVVLGSVVLCITGAEALYADMGHFGARPIRLGWFAVVFPALLLNYFGQGAELLLNPASASNPFYALVPTALLYPMVGLSTFAAAIASQAMISGAFSLTRQAVQLGYMPRVQIVHTSGREEGQIFIPEVNNGLMVACIALVLTFQESSRLAAAYGIAVTTVFVITSFVYFYVARRAWGWPLWKALPLLVLFLTFDVSYLGANLFKFFDGGWVPVLIAVCILVVMTTWKRGRAELAARVKSGVLPLDLFLEDVERRKPHRVAGTAVFMFSDPHGTPPALLHHLKHNQVLHEQVVLLSILSEDLPTVPEADRLKLEPLSSGFFRLQAHYGFMESPNVPDIMRRAWRLGLTTDPNTTSYYLGRESLLTSGDARMMRWRKLLFAFVSKNARTATAYYGLPPGRVVELGMQIDL